MLRPGRPSPTAFPLGSVAQPPLGGFAVLAGGARRLLGRDAQACPRLGCRRLSRRWLLRGLVAGSSSPSDPNSRSSACQRRLMGWGPGWLPSSGRRPSLPRSGGFRGNL